MICVTVRQEAERRGLKTAYQLGVAAGIPQSLASRLWKGKPLPRLESLAILCESWRVDLSTLVKWEPSKRGSASPPRRDLRVSTNGKTKAAKRSVSKRA